MERISATLEEEYIYDIDILIGETAYIATPDGKNGLLNIKTNEIIGSLGDFYTLYSTFDKYYFQEGEYDDCEESTVKKNSKKEKMLRFYDAENNKMVFDCWPIVYKSGRDYDSVVLRCPDTLKYHIFSKKEYFKSNKIFDMEFDYVERLYSRFGGNIYVVTKNNKKGICDPDVGLKVPIIYDNIERKTNVTILTNGEVKYFLWDYSNSIISAKYVDITEDDKNSNIIYGKSYYGTEVFLNDKFMFSGNYSKVEFVCKEEVMSEYEYFFKVTRGKKVGLINVKYDKINKYYTTITLLETVYDNIEKEYDDYFLYSDGKVGLYKKDKYSVGRNLVPTLYDNIKRLYNDYYAFYNGELCNIAHIKNHTNHEVSYCKIVDSYSEDSIIIYIKADKYGIFATDRNAGKYKTYGYDNIVNKTGGYFELERNGLKGMWFCHGILADTIYDSIQINGDSKYSSTCTNLSDAKTVYLGLEKDGKFTLSKCTNHHYCDNDILKLEDNVYDEMEFLPNIIVAKITSSKFNRSKNKTYVYNYSGEILKVFDGNINISYDKDKSKKNIIYLVGDTYYIFKDGNFEEAYIGKSKVYISGYETEYGVVVVNSYSSEMHNNRCKKIEALSLEEVNDRILTYVNENEKLLNKYPKLVRKK